VGNIISNKHQKYKQRSTKLILGPILSTTLGMKPLNAGYAQEVKSKENDECAL
jgi:hypothetical protein